MEENQTNQEGQNNPSQTLSNYSETPQKPKSFFKLTKPNVVGLITLFLLATSVMASYFVISKNRTEIAQRIEPAVTPTPDPNDISNWKIYVSNDYGFSFKYPNRLIVEPEFEWALTFPGLSEIEYSTWLGDPNTYRKIPGELMVSDPGYRHDGLQIIIPQIDGRSNDEFLEYLGTLEFEARSLKYIATSSAISINNRDWTIIKGSGGYAVNHYVTTLPNGKLLFVNLTETEMGSFLKEFNQVLSSFEFGDQTETLMNTSNWKTLTFEEISFRYPPNWEDAEYADGAANIVNKKNNLHDRQIIVLSGINKDNTREDNIKYLDRTADALGKVATRFYLDGSPAMKGISNFDFQNSKAISVEVVDKKGSFIYQITFNAIQSDKEAEALFDQILSTFEFID